MRNNESKDEIIELMEVSFNKYKKQILEIRKEVFVKELQIIDYELTDDDDLDCNHLVIFIDKIIIAIGRISSNGFISKLAVKKEYRGKGYASKIINESISYVKKLNLEMVRLESLIELIDYYQGFKFNVCSNKYNIHNKALVQMKRLL